MKLFVIRESYFINIVILLFSLFISWIGFLFGFAHLIFEFDYKNLELTDVVGVVFCVFLCFLGVLFLLVAIASIKGIIYKIKKSLSNK